MPICAYCKEDKKLHESHAIPSEIFKIISRENSGKIITTNIDDGDTYHIQDLSKGKLLCKECETEFNRRFDLKFVRMLKHWDREVIEEGKDIQYICNTNHLAQSLASIFWRACLIKNDFYSDVDVSPYYEDQLLSIVKGEEADSLKGCSVHIKRLDGFDKKTASTPSTALTSTIEVNEWGDEKMVSCRTFSVLMLSFSFEFTIVKPESGQSDEGCHEIFRSMGGFLFPNSKLIDIPLIHFRDHPAVAKMLNIGIKKIS